MTDYDSIWHTQDEISPLFEQAYNLDNIILPEGW